MAHRRTQFMSNSFLIRPEVCRTAAILGEDGMRRLANAHVAVFGIGGVGGYVCEALARSGVGTLTLIDKDVVSLSNINRQIIALHSTLGRYKTEVMAERIHDIAPECRVYEHRMFYLPENADFLHGNREQNGSVKALYYRHFPNAHLSAGACNAPGTESARGEPSDRLLFIRTAHTNRFVRKREAGAGQHRFCSAIGRAVNCVPCDTKNKRRCKSIVLYASSPKCHRFRWKAFLEAVARQFFGIAGRQLVLFFIQYLQLPFQAGR